VAFLEVFFRSGFAAPLAALGVFSFSFPFFLLTAAAFFAARFFGTGPRDSSGAIGKRVSGCFAEAIVVLSVMKNQGWGRRSRQVCHHIVSDLEVGVDVLGVVIVVQGVMKFDERFGGIRIRDRYSGGRLID
jgi:hypothetical protein